MNEEVKTTGRDAPHVVYGLGSQLARAVAGLLEKLATRGVIETLAVLDASTRKDPFAYERTGSLFDEEDPSTVVDARDDRADPRRLGHGC
jgi:hypothetical protein